MKQIMLVFFALLLSSQGFAQVNLNLSFDADTKVYTVSILPDITWQAPKNMLASAQVVLKVPFDTEFTPGITSLVDGLVWADNAYVENPAGAPGFTFVCIALVNGPTTKIELVEGKEFPLFSFVNAGGDCVGLVELLPNEDSRVQTARSSGLNITQHMAILGARGNAVSGIGNSSVDCSPASGIVDAPEKLIEDVKIAPVPADKSVTIQWTQLSELNVYKQIIICDVQGREMLREKIGQGKGGHSLQLNVENWQSGMYRVRFMFENGQQTQAWNMMVIH